MEIALGMGLNLEAKRGADVYFEGLARGLAEAGGSERFTLFAYFFRDYEKKRASLPQPPDGRFRLCAKRWPESVVNALEWGLGLPVIDRLFVRPGGFSIYHALGGRLPHLSRAKTVATVYDMLFELAYEKAVAEGRRPEVAATTPLGDAARRADRVITISHSTKRDLCRIYGIDPGKVTVVHLGVDHGLFRPQAREIVEAARQRHRLSGRYFLFMGPFEPRRNAELTLRAVARLRRGDIQLVFVGKPNAHLESLKTLARELGLEDGMRCLGYLPREELPAVYQGALAFVHPETYDGFSLPLLEAMASGAPAVTSNTSALPEIAGEAALMVSPTDEEGLAKLLKDILEDEGLRRELSNKSLAQAARFSWKKTAQETLKVYEGLAS